MPAFREVSGTAGKERGRFANPRTADGLDGLPHSAGRRRTSGRLAAPKPVCVVACLDH